ncbi:MAG: NifB/NifX family molybdenum-iron cluster-binding protein [Kiritimatiellaeota bacterium]|nr:NifB/NifX family molybdenum-iron cluster-binding protein [Kiritimatiellota bacterium]
MKIAITTSGTDLTAPVDTRFGRAASFIVYDTESETFEVADNNQNLNAPQGAGIQTAQNVAATGAKTVITGHCGPKAFRILSASNIAVYPCSAATVQEALELFKTGKLTEANGADVEGHWA